MYYGYILFSPSKKRYYVGTTGDLDRRFHEHQTGQNPSTKAGSPWKPVYVKEFRNRSEACQWERWVKAKKSSSSIRKIIDAG